MDELKLEYVGFWARVGASIIDSILMRIILVPVARIFGVGGELTPKQSWHDKLAGTLVIRSR